MARGRRLSKAEIRQHKQWLAAWRAPKSMLEYLSDVMGSLGKGVFGAGILYTQAGLRFLHEAHVAGTFAIARRASSVRLILNDPPDFEMQFGTRTEQFECIEADVSGRRRGDEYHCTAQLCNHDDGFAIELEPVKELSEIKEEIKNALKIALIKKAKKIYQIDMIF